MSAAWRVKRTNDAVRAAIQARRAPTLYSTSVLSSFAVLREALQHAPLSAFVAMSMQQQQAA